MSLNINPNFRSVEPISYESHNLESYSHFTNVNASTIQQSSRNLNETQQINSISKAIKSRLPGIAIGTVLGTVAPAAILGLLALLSGDGGGACCYVGGASSGGNSSKMHLTSVAAFLGAVSGEATGLVASYMMSPDHAISEGSTKAIATMVASGIGGALVGGPALACLAGSIQGAFHAVSNKTSTNDASAMV